MKIPVFTLFTWPVRNYTTRVSQIEAFCLCGAAGRLNFTSFTELAYGFSTFKIGGKHASVHGFFFLQVLGQLFLGPLQVLLYFGICLKKKPIYTFVCWKNLFQI